MSGRRPDAPAPIEYGDGAGVAQKEKCAEKEVKAVLDALVKKLEKADKKADKEAKKEAKKEEKEIKGVLKSMVKQLEKAVAILAKLRHTLGITQTYQRALCMHTCIRACSPMN